MGQLKLKLMLLCFTCCIFENCAAPTETTPSLVVSSTTPLPKISKLVKKEINRENESKVTFPKIYQMHIKSKISNRFSNTTITSRVKNVHNKAQEAVFSVLLPDTAFISGFVMEVNGKNYTAYVKETEEAKTDYEKAVSSGVGAAHVAVSARDSNSFTVSVNVEPETKAAFYLTYVQLLIRDAGHYEQVININPGQLVTDFSVEVSITESSKIVDLKAPPLRSGKEIDDENSKLDPRVDIKTVNDKEAVVTFAPNEEQQKQFARLLNSEENNGFSGQFVVQYDVDRNPQGGQILTRDGYFVHFFAPTELEPLPKHVIFILDTSLSMEGLKIQLLKESMNKILRELHPKDIFNLVEFNSIAKVWNLNDGNSSVSYPGVSYWDQEDTEVSIDNFIFPNAYSAKPDIIQKAVDTVTLHFNPDGATNIKAALKVGLRLANLAKENKVDEVNRQSLLLFLTDGEPTVGETSPERIAVYISEFNSGSTKLPIFTLSFGDDADKTFLQKLSLRNRGFYKHIYEAEDAALQLHAFYRQISSPLLTDISFKYDPSVTDLTTTEFPIHFEGSEIVVTGRSGNFLNSPIIEGRNDRGLVTLKPTVEHSGLNIEPLWAYLKLKKLLEKMKIAVTDKDKLHKEALDLALKYSFVTPISSLVVIKSNKSSAVDTEAASEEVIFGTSNVQLKKLGRYAKPAFSPTSSSQTKGLIRRGHGDFSGSQMTTVKDIITREFLHPPKPKLKLAEPVTEPLVPIFGILPWLRNIAIPNGLIFLENRYYKLESNETITDGNVCSTSLHNATGHCSLLEDCPQVHSLLTTRVFLEEYCILKNEFAGICCPV